MSEVDPTKTHVAAIVAAYASNNRLSPDELLTLIRTVFGVVEGLSGSNTAVNGVTAVNGAKTAAPAAEVRPQPQREPAVSPNKSVFRDYIICLEDGKRLKMLKRHLNTTYGLTPDQYRTKWGLPYNYPMVAPAYAQRRRDLAISIGLGTTDKTPNPRNSKKTGGKVGRPRRVVVADEEAMA